MTDLTDDEILARVTDLTDDEILAQLEAEEALKQPAEAAPVESPAPGAADTQPQFLSAPEVEPEPEPAPEPVAAPVSRDPKANVANALIALGRIYNDAGDVSDALSTHLRNVAGEPELHGFLHRMQTLLGEFRNAVTQIETGMSDRLADAIAAAV